MKEGLKRATKQTGLFQQPAKQCRIEGCRRPYRAKGYCPVHYREWRHGKFGKRRFKTCHAEGCSKPMTPTGLCEQHSGRETKETEALKEAQAAAQADGSSAS